MIALGAGLYLAYTPFNALLFDRFIAASGRTGTAGFLIYVADAAGYMSSVALLVFYNFVGVHISWVQFLVAISYAAALAGLGLVGAGVFYFHRHLRGPRTQIASLDDIERLYSPAAASTMARTSPRSSTPCNAPLAEAEGAPDSLIVAALLHDIGHLFEDEEDVTMAHSTTVTKRRRTGAGHFFGEAVWRPIALHVAAKRYLCFRAAIFGGLQRGLAESLALQGGAFSPAGGCVRAAPIGVRPCRCDASMTWASGMIFPAAPSPISGPCWKQAAKSAPRRGVFRTSAVSAPRHICPSDSTV